MAVSLGRVLAFDFGMGHIGVAVGNEDMGTAQGLIALEAVDGVPKFPQKLESLFEQWKPEYVVVGYPLNMDGTDEEMGKRARKFGRRLMSAYKIRVYFKDERLTSTAAREEIFEHQGGYRALLKHKGRIDSTAARLILEGFFDLGGRDSDVEYCDPASFLGKNYKGPDYSKFEH